VTKPLPSPKRLPSARLLEAGLRAGRRFGYRLGLREKNGETINVAFYNDTGIVTVALKRTHDSPMSSNLYLGLVHHPVYDKRGEVVATAVTNFDIHDISRCARTFGVGGFFIITPLESQVALTERIIRHWMQGAGSVYNPTRKESLSLVRVSRTIDQADQEISQLHQKQVKKIATGASPYFDCIHYGEMQRLLKDSETPFFLLFGTGWGLTREVKESSDYVLAPIEGKGYNHLSVRSAVAIILDRLLGDRISSSE
jgi:hypothetical protein